MTSHQKKQLLYLSQNKNNKTNYNYIWIGNEREYKGIDLIMKILHNSTEQCTGNKMTILATFIKWQLKTETARQTMTLIIICWLSNIHFL